MPKDDWIYVGHMLEMGEKALELVSGKDRNTYDQDETLKLALTHLVQVIGGAANQVSEGFREVHQEIPWLEIIGMRNRIVHDYMNVDEDVIWEVVQQDLSALVEVISRVVPPEVLG